MLPQLLRLDDIGASSKQYEQYAKLRLRLREHYLPTPAILNVGGLKRVPLWQGWGVYRELNEADWKKILTFLRTRQAKMTVGVTAAWVDSKTNLIPYPDKFPAAAQALREGVQENLIEIAHHGLSHCVVENNDFRPRLFRSNRLYHREFWPWVEPHIHREHIFRAQEILTNYFNTDIVTFIPPGHVWTSDTENYARQAGLRYLSATEATAPTGKISNDLLYISTKVVMANHDRDIVLKGIKWLEQTLDKVPARVTIREYANTLTANKI